MSYFIRGQDILESDITVNPSSRAPYEELELYNLAAGLRYRTGTEAKI